jgi:hypothetical protein
MAQNSPAKGSWVNVLSLAAQLRFAADGQLYAAFGTPAGQYFAAIGGLHAGPKTVGFGPFALVGLPSAFHRFLRKLVRLEPKA